MAVDEACKDRAGNRFEQIGDEVGSPVQPKTCGTAQLTSAGEALDVVSYIGLIGDVPPWCQVQGEGF